MSSLPSLLRVACWPHGFEAQVAVFYGDEEVHLDAVVQAGRVWIDDAFRVDKLEMAVVAERCHVDVDCSHFLGAYNEVEVSLDSRNSVVLSSLGEVGMSILLTCVLVVVPFVARFVIALRNEQHLFAYKLLGFWPKLMPH